MQNLANWSIFDMQTLHKYRYIKFIVMHTHFPSFLKALRERFRRYQFHCWFQFHFTIPPTFSHFHLSLFSLIFSATWTLPTMTTPYSRTTRFAVAANPSRPQPAKMEAVAGMRVAARARMWVRWISGRPQLVRPPLRSGGIGPKCWLGDVVTMCLRY